jgi:hypothetical protein
LFFTEVGGVSTGFGGEVFVYKGLAADAEVGYVGPGWSFSRSGAGVGSANASYFWRKGKKVEPFASGGYSLFFGHGETNGYNLGGGVNFWLRTHLALRLEVREYPDAGSTVSGLHHFASFRVGMTFR